MHRARRLATSFAAAFAAAWVGGSHADALPRFPAGAVWNQDISQAAVHPQSATMVSTLAGLGGFGNGRMQIDFGMRVVHAPASAPLRSIVGYPDNASYYAPDCEPVGTTMPVPVDAAIEASAGLACANATDDCHLLVVQGNTLYEAYRANASGGSGLQAQCLARWNLDAVYPASNRGDHCTSADAAGFPIAPLLFNADDVYAATQVPNGDLGHAIRFILPNARMASQSGTKYYVRPASHAGGPTGPVGSVPYGSRLRLRGDFPVNLYNPAAQVLLRTMQRYGIVLADGGSIALTAEADLYTTHHWSELGIDSRTFDLQVAGAPVRVQDFDVLDTGARIVETYDCVRNSDPAPTPTLSIADAAVLEGNAGTSTARFVLALSQASASDVAVDVATRDGSAFAGTDYVARAQRITVPAGATSADFDVAVNGDASVEGNERFHVSLSNIAGADPGKLEGTGTIANDDLAQLRIGDASVVEGNAGTSTITFEIQLSEPMPTPVSFDVSTGGGTASAGSDYVARTQPGRLVDAGRTRVVFEVPVKGDTLAEGDETLGVTVSSVVGAILADGVAVGTIRDDDAPAMSAASVRRVAAPRPAAGRARAARATH